MAHLTVSNPSTSSSEAKPSHSGHGPAPPPHGDGDFGGWNPMGWNTPPSAATAGIYVALASVSMLFLSLTLVFVLRTGLTRNLARIPLPPVLYFNTAVLLVSSASLELARRGSVRGSRRGLEAWSIVTLALGIAFLCGQFAAWRDLSRAGVYIDGNPSSAFFYLITGAHGLHLLGGLIALAYVAAKAREICWGLKRQAAVEVTRIYWHFMGGLWVCLLGLLLWLHS